MQLPITSNHQAHKQLRLVSIHAMRLDTTSICMWYHSSPRSSPHDATKTSLSTTIINCYMDITSDTTYDIWTYDSINHAYVHNTSTTIINGYNQHQSYHIDQQLYTISHNPSKGENTSHYDKYHIQNLSIIHVSSYNHIKLFTKDLQKYSTLKIIFNKVHLSLYNF